MRYGFVLPYGDARQAAELAVIAEQSGWDGFFVWEPVWGVDAWVALTAAAMRTERIRLGTMLTPLPRRRPWELAGQVSTLDNLSGGRVILSVGLGAVHEGWRAFERDEGRRVRAGKLDEGLDILAGLWSGQPFSYQGEHYQVSETDFFVPAPPVQRPRVPVWVVGAWPRPQSMRRSARWDGWLPNYIPKSDVEHTEGGRPPVPEFAKAVEWLRRERGGSLDGYDVVMEGFTPADDQQAAADEVRPWAEAGATWWLEANWGLAKDEVYAASVARLEAGPPQL
ncbi:LLM class flavin-dependent oxidoreductase [Longispora albida]|uniref:LLM class flavin-dependent oxidoreductase n=1 Tax=Longispora albida TaxID=203523 RepID=UPI0004766125|nr:LLM class flavin-dependent oxidoreductase [Longispora albida]